MIEAFSGTQLPLLPPQAQGSRGFAGKRIGDGGMWKKHPEEIL
jgi:hypothetical protein